MNELERFLPRFIELATERIKRSLVGITDATLLRREMHTLAGEAGMLGLEEVSNLAHQLSMKASSVAGPPSSGDQASCARLLRSLQMCVDQLRPSPSHDDSDVVPEELAVAHSTSPRNEG